MKDEIPPMTDPLGRCWDQPDRVDIMVDGTHAVMTEATLKKLARYDSSIPSGVYSGKMWVRAEWDETSSEDQSVIGDLLCWFDDRFCTNPNKCAVEWRRILIV